MDNDHNKNKNPDTLSNRIGFKSLPFDEAEAYQRLSSRLKNPLIISYARTDSSKWKYLFAAASIALLLVSAIHLIGNKPKEALAYYETTAVPDSKTKIVLPDSSVVWLNANACLRYPREFTDQTRKVEITGEAFFEIRKDEKKPFIVHTDAVNIKVLGTSFNVKAEINSDIIEITLLKGKIALFSRLNQSDIADQILTPGQCALFHKPENNLKVSDIRAEKSISWVTGVFVFKENTLEEITNELQRAFHVKIHIEDKTMQKQTFNADFTEKETLDEILSILQISARYKIEKIKGEIFIK